MIDRVLARRLAGLAIAGVALVLIGNALGARDVIRGFDLLVLIAMAASWNLVGGYGGLFSVGHAMFVGTGSYACAMVIARTDLPMAAALAMAFVVPALVSGAVGLPLMRLRAAYFSVASLGIALAAQAWMLNWDWTGASTGLNMPLSSYVPPERQYLYAVGLLVVVLGVVTVVVRSGLGLRLMALRDDEEAAADIGIRRLPVAMTTWMLSGGLTGLAGALIALQKSSLEPVSAFSITFTLDMIVAAVIGGLSTIAGPIVGAVLVYVIRQVLQDYASWSTLINGLLIVAVIRFAPGGIVELFGRALRSVLPSRSVEDSTALDTPSQERTEK